MTKRHTAPGERRVVGQSLAQSYETDELEQLRDFVENAAIGLCRVDPEGMILWANRAELELLGYVQDEYVGRSVSNFHVDAAVADDMLARLSRGEELHNYEARLRARDGSIKHVLVNANVYVRDAKFVHTRCFTRDITERRSVQQALRQRDEQLRLVTDSLPVLVSFVGADECYQFVSGAYERWFGHGGTEVVGRHIGDVVGPEAYRILEPHIKRALAGSAVTFEAEVPYREGGTRYIEANYVPQPAANGGVSGFVALVADNSYRKSLERARARASERAERLLKITAAIANAVTPVQVFEALVDHAAEAIEATTAALWLLDDHNHSVKLTRALGYHDAAAARLEPQSIETVASSPVIDSIRRREPIWIADQQQLAQQYPHLGSFLMPHLQCMACLPLLAHGRVLGALVFTLEQARAASAEDREFMQLVARYASPAIERLRLLDAERQSREQASSAASDNSRLYKETSDARARAEQLYRFAQAVVAADRVEVVYEAALVSIEAALGTERAAVLIFDADQVMRFKAWHGLSDAYRLSVEGHSPWAADAVDPQPVLVADVRDDASLASYQQLFQQEAIAALAFIPLVNRGRLLGKFMVYYEQPHAFTSAEIETAGAIANHLACVITRFHVITQLEDTVRSNELFAGVLAHDLRNPLGAMMTAAQLILMQREGGKSGTAAEQRPLSRILSSGQRMATMIDQLLDFTRARSGGGIRVERVATDLAELCIQAVGELELSHPEWKIRSSVRGDQRGTWDPHRLVQVLSNLLANAGQHGASRSQITITLDGTHAEQVRVAVHNEGLVPEALQPHLFDPFRGTQYRHHRSNGLGLGLFIVREIVRAHGGTIDVASTLSAGTSFTIQLPRLPR